MDTKSEILLKDKAYASIKDSILNERYQPGSILSERLLIEELDMSKTPIKDAITKLQSEGFVRVSSKRGIVINDLSIEKINDIYNLRIALEAFNCEYIYDRITEEDLGRLEANIQKMSNVVKELNVDAFTVLDHKFHLIISEIAGNKEIIRILLNYNDHLSRITYKHLNKDPRRMIKFYNDHIEIFKLLKNHDPGSAEAIKVHLDNSKRLLYE